MIKPGSLREHLTAALPELRRDPDKLLVFIDRGSVVSTAAPGLSFEYRYTLNLILTDYAGHPDAVMVPLLVWLASHQPELLANPSLREQIAFEADLLANDKVDLDIKIPLTERVGVHARVGGGFDIEHYPEPQLELHLLAEHWALYVKNELVATWDNPAR
ncbi:MAG: phage tail protein [Lysobacter sp.]